MAQARCENLCGHFLEQLQLVADAPEHDIAIAADTHRGVGDDEHATGMRADLLYMRDYLTALLEFVRGEIKAGKPKDVIVKITDPLKGFPDHGPLIERVLTEPKRTAKFYLDSGWPGDNYEVNLAMAMAFNPSM